jgi:nucleoside-diphosphate-sugar epimerase
MKRALVCGAGGFIGGHLVNRLKSEGYWVRGVDLKYNEYGNGKVHLIKAIFFCKNRRSYLHSLLNLKFLCLKSYRTTK